MINNNYVILDFETGGRDASIHAVTQFAAYIVEPEDLAIIDRINIYCKPYEKEYEAKALETTGITISMLKKKGIEYNEFGEAIIDFFKLAKVGNRSSGLPIVVGQNVSFDLDFLNVIFQDCKKDIKKYKNDGLIDTMWMAKMKFQKQEGMSLSLGSIASEMGIELTDAHDASADVEATYKVFQLFTNILRQNTGKSGIEQGYAKFHF